MERGFRACWSKSRWASLSKGGERHCWMKKEAMSIQEEIGEARIIKEQVKGGGGGGGRKAN